jgi:hypothetical protein
MEEEWFLFSTKSVCPCINYILTWRYAVFISPFSRNAEKDNINIRVHTSVLRICTVCSSLLSKVKGNVVPVLN